MTLFELLTLVAIIAGAYFGAKLGFAVFGVLGLIAGIPLGGAVGYGLAILCIFLLACILSLATGTPLFKPKQDLAATKEKA